MWSGAAVSRPLQRPILPGPKLREVGGRRLITKIRPLPETPDAHRAEVAAELFLRSIQHTPISREQQTREIRYCSTRRSSSSEPMLNLVPAAGGAGAFPGKSSLFRHHSRLAPQATLASSPWLDVSYRPEGRIFMPNGITEIGSFTRFLDRSCALVAARDTNGPREPPLVAPARTPRSTEPTPDDQGRRQSTARARRRSPGNWTRTGAPACK